MKQKIAKTTSEHLCMICRLIGKRFLGPLLLWFCRNLRNAHAHDTHTHAHSYAHAHAHVHALAQLLLCIRVLCKYAKKTKKAPIYIYIIAGQCWSGVDAHETYEKYGASNAECYVNDTTPCNSSPTCTGGDVSNYVYELNWISDIKQPSSMYCCICKMYNLF